MLKVMTDNGAQAQKNMIEIIATSDVHGALFAKDFVANKNGIPSLASLSTYINQQRARKDRGVILLDNGDILQGDPVVYYYNFVDTASPHIAAQVINYLKYDAACIGNHDLESGKHVYDKYAKEINCPLISANITDKRHHVPYFKPYCILHKNGKKIAILGLTTPRIPFWVPEKLIPNLEFDDMVESAQYWVDIITKNEHPDILVGLFHSGTDYNYHNQGLSLYKNENSSELVAKNVDGFDVIIAGHDHQGHNYQLTNNNGHQVLMIAPTSRMKDFVDITIAFDSAGNKQISGKVLLTSSLNIDYDYTKYFSKYLDDVEQYFSEPVGIITDKMVSTDGLFEDDPMSNLIHAVQLHVTGADISFASPLSLNSVIDKGLQYRRDLFKLYRYDNLVYCMKLSGREIKRYLEYSYWGRFNKITNKNDYLLKYKLDVNGKLSAETFPTTEVQIYNYDSAEGIIYEVDVTRDKDDKINILSMNDGAPFDYDKMYNVALTSYRGSGGGDHLTLGCGLSKEEITKRISFISDYDIKIYLEQWIKDNSPINPDTSINWKIIPEHLTKQMIYREKSYFK